jgi:hypothetical protein
MANEKNASKNAYEDRKRAADLGIIALEGLAESVEGVRDLVKMRVAFWDKLTVLNAGTMALSFTAASVFQNRSRVVGGGGFLFASWKALIASIAFALIAQHLATASISRTQMRASMEVTKYKIERFMAEAGSVGIDLSKNSANKERFEKMMTDVRSSSDEGRRERLSNVSGAIAVILTVAAYCLLYKFASVNIVVH